MNGVKVCALLAIVAALGCGSSSGGSGNDAAADSTGGLPGFGQACAPIAQQGDPQCATGLVCISVGAEQGRNLCTKTCTTADAPCDGAPGGAPTCGRDYQVANGNNRVCEFFCDTAAPSCPPGTTCLMDYAGMTTCQPPIQ
ncbi:MAG TPA: hypothetical protein VIF57_17185 [Polyangia bacterium]|jgi:hypothetical protein